LSQTRWQWQRNSRQKVHFCSAESGSKDRVMCIGHWPVTRPDPAQNVDPATRWPVTRTTRFHLCPTHSTHFRSFRRRWAGCGISQDCSHS